MENDEKVNVSRYISYLLRHNPEDLEMDKEGFVDLDKLVSKIRRRCPSVDRDFLVRMVEESERKRFEIVDDKIRALYGHTIPVQVRLEEDKQIAWLYHGTTAEAAKEILEKGLRPMRRRWVHLSPTEEIALDVGRRRTNRPMILVIDVAEARKHGVKFFRVTDNVYVCKYVSAKYIKMLHV